MEMNKMKLVYRTTHDWNRQAQIYRHLVGGAPPVAGRVLSQLLKEDLARDFQVPRLDSGWLKNH